MYAHPKYPDEKPNILGTILCFFKDAITFSENDFQTGTLENLEKWFDDYNNEKITLKDYIDLVQGLIRDIRRNYGLMSNITDTLLFFSAARRNRKMDYNENLEAAQWCLKWAEDRLQNEFKQCLAEAADRWMNEVQIGAQPA